MARASRRKVSVVERHSPAGATAGRLSEHVHVPVAVVDVEVLGLHRRGQDDVGVVDGVGRELLDHDREQVLALRPSRTRAWSGFELIGLAP